MSGVTTAYRYCDRLSHAYPHTDPLVRRSFCADVAWLPRAKVDSVRPRRPGRRSPSQRRHSHEQSDTFPHVQRPARSGDRALHLDVSEASRRCGGSAPRRSPVQREPESSFRNVGKLILELRVSFPSLGKLNPRRNRVSGASGNLIGGQIEYPALPEARSGGRETQTGALDIGFYDQDPARVPMTRELRMGEARPAWRPVRTVRIAMSGVTTA